MKTLHNSSKTQYLYTKKNRRNSKWKKKTSILTILMSPNLQLNKRITEKAAKSKDSLKLKKIPRKKRSVRRQRRKD